MDYQDLKQMLEEISAKLEELLELFRDFRTDADTYR